MGKRKMKIGFDDFGELASRNATENRYEGKFERARAKGAENPLISSHGIQSTGWSPGFSSEVDFKRRKIDDWVNLVRIKKILCDFISFRSQNAPCMPQLAQTSTA